MNQAQQIIDRWDSLATSYEQLLKRQPIFSLMASRLVDLATAAVDGVTSGG